jgi:hypothetical protein
MTTISTYIKTRFSAHHLNNSVSEPMKIAGLEKDAYILLYEHIRF